MKTKNKFYMIICVILFIQFFSCTSNKYSKENLIYIKDIGDNLYIKEFRTYTGDATTSDSYSYYLIDSIHFRKFIREVNYDNEKIIWNKTKDHYLFFKKSTNNYFL